MHHWIAALLAIFSTIFAVLMVYLAFAGIANFGVTTQAELALGIIFFTVAIIAGWIAYEAYASRFSRVKTGQESLIGAKGVAVTDLKLKGEVRVMGEFWQATTKGQEIKSGQAIEVLNVDNIFLIVKSVEEKV